MAREESKMDKFPGHPPEDYTGTIADWMVGLQKMGLWDGKEKDVRMIVYE